jgi:predicted DNA-binding protein (UPF0251 family)
MVRPKKCRMVASVPNVTYYKPAGIPLRFLNEVRLSIEEAEALRLKDLEGLEQSEGAVKMGISRPTFQRILSSARKKVADALLNGKAIRIEGGNFQVTGTRTCCHRGHNGVRQLDSTNADTANCPVCGNPEARTDSPSDEPGQNGTAEQRPARTTKERGLPLKGGEQP